jgi:flagellar protein FliS
MRNPGYQKYFDNEVLTASPLRLIELLYADALHSIMAARRHVRSGNILARTRSINKAWRVVAELSQCLNREAGGELSRNLAGLYAHVSGLLVQANIQQSEAPLSEAETLLSTLAQAWKDCVPPTPDPDSPASQLLRRDATTAGDLASPAFEFRR